MHSQIVRKRSICQRSAKICSTGQIHFPLAACVAMAAALCIPQNLYGDSLFTMFGHEVVEDHHDPVELFYISGNQTRYMDNDDMESAAQSLYETEGNLAQRTINQQWLYSFENEHKRHEGSKALSRFAQKFLKGYWQSLKETRYKDNNAIPDSNGTWTTDDGVDYNVRLSGNELKLRLTYDF